MKIKFCLALMILMIAGFAMIAFGNDSIKPVIIDVRTNGEWNDGHLDGAVLIPYDQMSKKIDDVVKDINRLIIILT